jgi:hypothetical protein
MFVMTYQQDIFMFMFYLYTTLETPGSNDLSCIDIKLTAAKNIRTTVTLLFYVIQRLSQYNLDIFPGSLSPHHLK